MDERRGYKHSGPKVAREEEEMMRHRQARETSYYDGKGACCDHVRTGCCGIRQEIYIPAVLSTRIRMRAPIWSEVL